MRKERLRTRLLALSLTLAVVVLLAGRASAVTSCNTAIVNPSSPLTDDYTFSANLGTCIQLTNGADLDLNGHTITYTGTAGNAWRGIICSGRGSVITDSAATKGKITSTADPYLQVIESCEEIDGVVIEGTRANYEIKNVVSGLPLRRATNNVFSDPGGSGRSVSAIYASYTTWDAEISGNTIANAQDGIVVGGSTAAPGVLVTNNSIDDYAFGLTKTGTANVRFVTNTLTNRDSGYPGSTCIDGETTAGSYSFKNSCDCSADCPTITDCTSTVTFSSNTTLTSDYESNGGSGPCIQLNSHADLDLNGHTISHVGSGAGSAAVKCAADASLITNTGHRALVRGDWTSGTLDCEKVDNVSFGAEGNGTIGTAIKSGTTFAVTQVTNNVIDGTTNGVDVGKFFDASSVVDNNGISVAGTAITVVGTTGTGGPFITDNVLRGYGIGIKKTGTDKVRVRRNLLLERDTGYSGGSCLDIVATGATVDSNICDCLDVCPIGPPFAFPWF